MTDTRPNAIVEWATFITENYRGVFTPEQMESLGYEWYADCSLPDGGEWRHLDTFAIEDEISNVENELTGGFTELTREVEIPANTTDQATDEDDE